MRTIFPGLLTVCLLFAVEAGLCAQTSFPKTERIARADTTARFKRWYFYWGYNRAIYSTSTLHFNGRRYDFTLHDLVAHDRPTRVTLRNYLHPASIWTPQYNIRIGYRLNACWSVSFGMDHMKYVADAGQATTISGIITEAASSKYAGQYLHTPITLEPDLLKFEHTDGLNLTTFDVERNFRLLRLPRPAIRIDAHLGLGGIWVATRTDVTMFGQRINNNIHVAGYSLAAKAGLRVLLGKRFFLMAEMKSGYMTLPAVLVHNDAPEIGDHSFTFLERMAGVGFDF
jgi:hypothetical protein